MDYKYFLELLLLWSNIRFKNPGILERALS